jgi:hypothetical protein
MVFQTGMNPHCIVVFYELAYRVINFAIALKFMFAQAFFFKNGIERLKILKLSVTI